VNGAKRPQALDNRRRLGTRARGQHEGEFITAQAKGTIQLSANRLTYRICKLPQHLISGGMAEPVVDLLEAVQVEIDQAQRNTRTLRAGALDIDEGPEDMAVLQAGQSVRLRLRFEPAMIVADFRDQGSDDRADDRLGDPAACRAGHRSGLQQIGHDRHRHQRVHPGQATPSGSQGGDSIAERRSHDRKPTRSACGGGAETSDDLGEPHMAAHRSAAVEIRASQRQRQEISATD